VTTLLWFRRDLRLGDQPTIHAALAQSDRVVAVFVRDPRLDEVAGPGRRWYLTASLSALNEQLDGRLWIAAGDPAAVIPELARTLGARSVHICRDSGPYGRDRDSLVAAALRRGDPAVTLHQSGSPYAIEPGTVRKPDGTAYRVFTPFYRAWCALGWPPPLPSATPTWLPPPPALAAAAALTAWRAELPPSPAAHVVAGEVTAIERWRSFRPALVDYRTLRDRPDVNGTSRLSAHLRWGEIHPRTLLDDLTTAPGDEAFRREIAWREFYADVLAGSPDSARTSLARGWDGMGWDDPRDLALLPAWQAGQTGYPMVDAGMRQLSATGWMHNRVRMIVASFLVKDLHLHWRHGAAWFMHHLHDGDLASNSHGWQWVAGSGTDAAPYYRVFNPVRQGLTFDPDGEYVRTWVPELAHLPGPAAHEPWRHPAGAAGGYPERIVDHAQRRALALARYHAARGRPLPD